jgi:hypothetical protein
MADSVNIELASGTRAEITSGLQARHGAFVTDETPKPFVLNDGTSKKNLAFEENHDVLIDTMVDLRAIPLYSGTPRYTRIAMGGYYAKGDGKAFKRYYWSSASTATHNGGTVVQPISAPATGRFLADEEDIVTPYNFGGKDDGTDATTIFQTVLDLLKGDDATGDNKKFSRVYIPTPPDGAYWKISDSLVIDGTHGGVIYGDNSYVQREGTPASTDTQCSIRWYGASSKPIFRIKGNSSSPSNPNFMIRLEDLTISGYESQIVVGSEPSTLALSGIHVGNIIGESINTLNRLVTIKNCVIRNCRFGIWAGSATGGNTDNAPVVIEKCFISKNTQHGIYLGTANAIFDVSDCYVDNNGWKSDYPSDAYSVQKGSNVYIDSGSVDIKNYTSAGSGTTKPDSADIYQASGRVSIINAWSDTHGYFFYQGSVSENGGGAGYHAGQITGVRHYEGGMTDANTPTSLRITGPGTIVTSCLFYNDIEAISGLGGKPVFIGVNFVRSDATYVGTGVDTQRSLVIVGNKGNSGQIFTGGANAGIGLGQKSNDHAHHVIAGEDPTPIEIIPPSLSGTGYQWRSRTDDADGAHEHLYNCYYQTNITHAWNYDTEVGTYLEGELLSWTSGTGTLKRKLTTGAVKSFYISLVSGTAPANNDVITGAGSLATSAVDGSPITIADGYLPYQNNKACFRLLVGGANGFILQVADPNNSLDVLSFTSAGGYKSATTVGLRTEIVNGFPSRASDPTFSSGDFWKGYAYYNSTRNRMRMNAGTTDWKDVLLQLTDISVTGLNIKTGSNTSVGEATLVAGTVTVNNTRITANTAVYITHKTAGGTPGWLQCSARVASTSFTILSSSGTDTSVVSYVLIEPEA